MNVGAPAVEVSAFDVPEITVEQTKGKAVSFYIKFIDEATTQAERRIMK